ncbi:hypothetical protein [Saccharothrix luteola]|uniref:hypothetical protein n=1 Tax=Saccharothrix luteola TaxID=2893018 RepID=UPI001E5247B7|nr:hypothetical protein [Saccharothrix luteola]MCC8247427.1 hypothetical protein [Saccharothrix luteola]
MTLSKRVVARRSLAFVAALAVTATLSAAARAQGPGTSPVAAEPVLTTSSPDTPSVQARPAATEPTGSQQAAAPAASSPTAAAAKLAISATVGAGPYLVGEQIPVEVTLSNTGDADATGVKADGYSSAGSTFLIQSSEWGDLALSGPGVTLPAGGQRVVTVRGEVQGWSGAPVAKFSIWQGNASVTDVKLPLPVRDPNSAADTLAGLVYGDRNGNGAPDAGEALQGVRVTVTTNGPPWTRPEATTGADGRFRFADLPVQVYGLYTDNAPDGWVIEPKNSYVAVDGSGSAANLLLRGQRPLTDHLSAAMRFTQDVYRVGDRAEVAVTLTNTGTADLTGIKADCQRANDGGPELRDLALGDLGWGTSGVTVPAGQSRAFTISGTVSEVAAEYGAVDHLCEFGPGESRREGVPRAYALAKVPGPAVTSRMAFYHDRDGDLIGEPDEMLGGLAVILRDAVTGEVAAEGRTDAGGHVHFENLPSGPYTVRVYGAWKSGDAGVVFAGTCHNCQAERWVDLVPAPDVTNTRRTGG